MKMKETLKRFWTLDTRHAGGFTLVELIVVIAILAILAGVAIPAYSGYITKANKQADMSLVSEVANALVLHQYTNLDKEVSGFVVLNGDANAYGSDADAEAAMKAVFGENWAESTNLKYTGWDNSKMLSYVLDNQSTAGAVADSTYLKNSSASDLMGAVTGLTKIASTAITGWGGNVADTLNGMGMSSVVEALPSNLTPGTTEYNTAVSNLLVDYFAGAMKDMTTDSVQNADELTKLAVTYASLYAYSSTQADGQAMMDAADSYLKNVDSRNDLTSEALMNYMTGINNGSFVNGYMNNYFTVDEETGNVDFTQQYEVDMTALFAIMGAADQLEVDKDHLTNADLYTSSAVAEQVNNYITAVNAVATLDSVELTKLQEIAQDAKNAVIVLFINGEVSALPSEAFLAGSN